MLRQAKILRDTDGLLAGLKQNAQDFKWESLQSAADAHASYALHMMVETIFKDINAFDSPETLARNMFWLTEPLTELMAVHCGVLFTSSKTFLPQIRTAMGEESAWTCYHRDAFNPRLSVEDRTRAGLHLFVETARLLDPILSNEDRLVVNATVARTTDFLGA
jgi:hypothetical protein